MDSELRCRIVGHSAQIVAICINEKCQNQRGLCGLCILQETHWSDPQYDKNQVLSLDQFNQRLIEKSQSNEQLINDYEGSIEILRYQYKNITDQLQQMIRQEEIKRNELYVMQAKLASFIKNIFQQQITNNLLNEMLKFYYNQATANDTKISYLFYEIDKLLERQTKIIIINKDGNQQSQQNQLNINQTFIPPQMLDSQFLSRSNNQSTHQIYHIQYDNAQIQDPSICQQLVDHQQDILIAQLSPNRLMIASADTENVLLLWNTIELQAQQKFVNNCHIFSLCFSDDSKWLLTGDDEGCIKIFDLNIGLQPQIFHKLQDSAILGIFQINENYLLQDMNGHIYNCKFENCKFTVIQDYDSEYPYINQAQYFQSSRDLCMAKQIYAFTNLQTIYFYSLPNIREINMVSVFRELGQIAFQENNSQFITTFLDKNEIFIWNITEQLSLQQKLVISCMPLNVSFYASMIVYQTLNSIQVLSLENNQLQKIINIPYQSVKLSPLFKFYITKQTKDQQAHLCLRANTLIFIKE